MCNAVVSSFFLKSTRKLAAVTAAVVLSVSLPASFARADDESVPWTHAISMHGQPALEEGQAFPYVNPEAPKGGASPLAFKEPSTA